MKEVKFFKTVEEAKKYGDKLKMTGIPHTIEVETVNGFKKDFALYKVTVFNS